MKKVLLYASVVAMAGMSIFCKNNSSGTAGETQAAKEIWPERTDSLAGAKGCERAGFRATSATEREFTYQHELIRVTDRSDAPGQQIRIFALDSVGKEFEVNDEGAIYFNGVARNHLLLSVGSVLNNREIIIYNMGRPAKVYQSAYYGEIEVTSNGNVRFLLPIEEKDMLKVPECAEKEEWTKAGKKIGYGQVCLYSLTNRSLTQKSEYQCVALP